MRTAQALAIHGHDLIGKQLSHRGAPLAKARGELLRIDQRKHAPKAIMRGDTMRQRQKGAQPGLLRLGERRHPHPTVGTAQGCRDGDDDHLVDEDTGVGSHNADLPRQQNDSQSTARHSGHPWMISPNRQHKGRDHRGSGMPCLTVSANMLMRLPWGREWYVKYVRSLAAEFAQYKSVDIGNAADVSLKNVVKRIFGVAGIQGARKLKTKLSYFGISRNVPLKIQSHFLDL